MATDLVHQFQRARRDPSLAVLEGFHAIKHAVRFGADIVAMVAVDIDDMERLAGELAPDLQGLFAARATPVPDETFRSLTRNPPPTDAMAVAVRPQWDLPAVLDDPAAGPVVLLERPRNLGNVGAAVRVAAAAGAAAVLTTGPNDPWDPSALRGAAGLHYALPVARVERLPETDRPVVAIDPAGEPAPPGGIPERSIVAFGTERGGLSPSILGAATMTVRIPMRSGVSSLNLATSVAALLFGCRGMFTAMADATGVDERESAIRKYLLYLEDPSKLRDEAEIERVRRAVDEAGDPVDRLKAIAELKRISEVEEGPLRQAFVSNVKPWADEVGVPLDAFREMRVPDDVLREAGFDVPATRRRGRDGAGGASPQGRQRARPVPAEEIKAFVLRLDGTFLLADVMNGIGGSPATVRKAVDELIEAGQVEKLGPVEGWSGRGRAPVQYRRR